MTSRDVVFRDRYGLHPRAARRIGEAIGDLTADVSITNLDGSASQLDARSMLALIGSGIRTGDRVRIAAEGADEAAAIEAIGDLLEAGVCHPAPSL
ncbi:MAG TPA: HPr family phosphocarrier protein [Candidatus Limnocylindria bacterium]|nr:HPr family phosphocarrier protein [Candidatus Limnocylindria bacterium]